MDCTAALARVFKSSVISAVLETGENDCCSCCSFVGSCRWAKAASLADVEIGIDFPSCAREQLSSRVTHTLNEFHFNRPRDARNSESFRPLVRGEEGKRETFAWGGKGTDSRLVLVRRKQFSLNLGSHNIATPPFPFLNQLPSCRRRPSFLLRMLCFFCRHC